MATTRVDGERFLRTFLGPVATDGLHPLAERVLAAKPLVAMATLPTPHEEPTS